MRRLQPVAQAARLAVDRERALEIVEHGYELRERRTLAGREPFGEHPIAALAEVLEVGQRVEQFGVVFVRARVGLEQLGVERLGVHVAGRGRRRGRFGDGLVLRALAARGFSFHDDTSSERPTALP